MEPGRRIDLAGAEQLHVDVARPRLEDQHPRPQALSARHVFTGREHDPARRLGRAQARVGPHPAAPRAVALGAQQPVGIAMETLHVAD